MTICKRGIFGNLLMLETCRWREITERERNRENDFMIIYREKIIETISSDPL
jgi:hypothetical protein